MAGLSPDSATEEVAGPDFVNVAVHLRAMARERPDAPAVACPAGRDRAGRARHTHWTFRQLDRESDALAHALAGAGVGRGTLTALMVKPSLEFFALTFALFKLGAPPVLIDPGIGAGNIGRCLAGSRPQAFVGIPKAQWARRLLGWGRESIRVAVTVGCGTFRVVLRPPGKAPALRRPEGPFPIARTRGDELAAVLFTSGSTGPPKGAAYTHSIFEAQVAALRDLYGIGPGEVDLCTFPLFALFGPALGMSAVIPEMDATRPARVDPTRILEAIEDFGVTNMFGSPALLRRVGEHGARIGATLPTLRRVISAGAPVPAPVLETFTSVLAPGVQVFTPYGATEALPVCSIGSDEVLGETRHRTDQGGGVCVGRPVAGIAVAIVRIVDGPIAAWSDDLLVPDGEVGEIVVRGPVVTREYFDPLGTRPEANLLAKVPAPDVVEAGQGQGQGQVYHRMGDLGYRDPLGRIWFCGRKTQRVVTPTGTLYTIPCEAVFNTHPEVFRTALVGVEAPGGVVKPVLCVEPRARLDRAGRARVRDALLRIAEAHPHTREIATILFHPAFPVDIRHNAKIFRERLAAWAARRLR